MTTQAGSNVQVAAVEGNFDDAQSAVKRIFGDRALAERRLRRRRAEGGRDRRPARGVVDGVGDDLVVGQRAGGRHYQFDGVAAVSKGLLPIFNTFS